ncbi:DUF2061 domain-containing protein [Massilia sp. DWR3-1-1]|uniref:DUF2061 domain-containing protein n=1 Tax=Massilia sp. DWR3-1-1 TaxID=2804559 RepID=UPI003CFA6F63
MMITAAKRASQLATHIGIGFLVAATLSGSAILGGLAMLIEPLINVMMLPFHEHAWARRQALATSDGGRYALVAAEKISQTALHAIVAFVVMFSVTGSVACGGIAALVEPLCNVLVMPVHDRLWEQLRRRLATSRDAAVHPHLFAKGAAAD